MRPSGLSWAWLVIWTTCLILTAVQVSGRRSRLRRTHRGPIAVPVVQSELPDILPKTRTALHGRIRSVHGTRASAISHSGSPADPEHAIPQNVARTTPEAKASHRVSRVRTINTRARTGMHARSRFHTIPAAKANQEDPESKQTLVQVTTLGKDGTKNPDAMPRQVTEVTQARETTKGDATVTSYDHPKAKEPPKRRTRKKLPPSVTILRSRIVHTTKSRGRDVEVTPVEDEKTGRKLIPLRGLRGRRRGNRRTERVHADSEAKEAITNSTLPVIIDPEVRDKPAAETENAPVTVIPAGNPSRVKLARGRTNKRRLLRPLTWLLTTPSIAGQDTESETPIKGMRTHRVSVGHRRGQRQRGSTTSGNQTTQVHSNGNPERVKLVRRPETARRRLRLTTTHSADMISGTESVTAETVLGRRRHRIGGRKRIKVHTTTTPATTTVWPPSVAFPTQGPSMGGNPFEGILSKGDLFKMGRGLHPDWWQDPTVGECPGEHLVVHSSLYFHCARRDHNDLSDPYGKCIHGDSMCKQESSMSKCCYNGCGDICLKPEKLIHQFCYEAMGSIRYQPGEEFMHGEWWCKCDPKKKSYQEMCTRLKCTIGDLVDDHDLNENSEESEESSEEESEEESTEEESSEEESNEEESNEEESSEEESGEEESSEEESEEEKSKSKKEPKCKKGSKGCGKGKRKPKCKKGKGKCKKPHSGGGRPKGKGKRCKKGDPKCKKPPPGGGSPGKWKKCKKGDPKCKKPHPGGGGPGKWKKCKKGDPKCKKPHPGGGSPGKGKKCKKGDHGCQKPHGRRPKWKRKCKKGAGKCGKPHRKCKNGKCKWHKKPKPPVTKWRPGGHGNGGWKKHKVTHVKKHNFSFKKPWKGRWKTKAWGKAWKRTWKKKWIKPRWHKRTWNRWRRPQKHWWGHKKTTWKKRWWGKRGHGTGNKKWHRKTNYKVVTKKWKVQWTLGKGSCEQIWVMGCNGLTLNEKLALDLILAIRESHYKWPEDFVKSSQSNGSAELSDMLKTAYLDNYYYGGFNDSLNWVLWVKGLKRACNTSVGDGIYPMTWSYSLQKWQEAMVSEFENRTTDDQLTYAKNWTSLWFDPLRDTCKRDVWIHFTEKRPQKNVGEFELIWHSGKTIELCTTNLELGWLMRFVPMYRRYVWTLILLGSKEGWYGPPQYKMIGAYWKYGARRYDYVLRSCYNIWSWGCNGTAVNETWAREWVKYSTMNGFSWDEDFVHSDMDVDGFVQTYGLDWDGLSVLNGTESEKLNWALWHDAYAKVCNATFGERSEEKLVDVIQEWKANKVAEFTRSSNITINGNWSDLWRYPFRHSCITKLKIYRRFAYDLIVRKGRHSMMGYWMQKYMKGDWNTAYFQNVKTWKVKEFSWDSFMDLSFFDSYGSCIDTWRPGCNTTLTNSSYLDMWRDLMDRAGFEWSGNFTLHTNNSFVEELADKFLPDRNMSDVADFNWAFWFDGWQAMCNASVEEEDGNMNWTHVVYRWASDWTERLDNERSSAVDWMKLWIEPLLYMCNYTGANDTISEDFTNLLTMSTGDGVHLTSSAIVAREIRFERVIERRMEEVRKQRRHYQYSFNYGLCISVWTSVCEGNKDLNMTEVNGLLQCLQRSTPALNFMNYTSDEVEQLLSTTSLMGLTDGETQLLNGLKNHTIPNISELVWKLWVGGWKSVCSKTDANGITLDEVLAALEETFEDNQLLQIGGTVDEWKKAWIQPWVGPCKGEAFSCEYQEEYEELGPMTWNYECSVYLNDTIQSFNWTSAGDDWKERCHFAYGSRFDWTDIDEVMKVWTDLCNAGANGGGNGGLLPYTEDKWDEDFDIACHKLKIFKIDDDGDGI